MSAAGLLGVGGYWLAYYALFLDPGERALVRGARVRPAAARVAPVDVPLFATSLEPYRERIAERLLEVAASGQLHPRPRGRAPSSASSPTTSACAT